MSDPNEITNDEIELQAITEDGDVSVTSDIESYVSTENGQDDDHGSMSLSAPLNYQILTLLLYHLFQRQSR
jgi:hypothetical protein